MIDKMPPQTWDEEADIIIVGSGFAGLAAAIEAKKAGSSVIILEKMKGYGGNSIISDGVIAAAATQMQADLEIADYYRIPLHSLKNTIEQFNDYVRHRFDKDFNKPILTDAQRLSYPPYFCIRLWPKVHHTMGGVLINSKAQVLNLSLQPIKGFYAAGEVTGGIHGACRLGSCAIIDCLVFGRIAGRNAGSKN